MRSKPMQTNQPISSRQNRRAMQEAQRTTKALSSLAGPNFTTLLVIRHGETDWNKEHRLQGQLDPGLNHQGLQQAEQLAEYFKSRQASLLDHHHHRQPEQAPQHTSHPLVPEQPISAVYSSDLLRAEQTAKTIADRIDLQTTPSKQLRERCLGVLQGLTSKEASQQLPDAWQFMSQGHHIAADQPRDAYGIETPAELVNRVAQEMEAIAANHPGETVLVVTHGGPIAAMHLHATGHSKHKPAKNGAVHVLVIKNSTWVVVDWDGWVAGPAALEGFGGGIAGG